MPLTCVACLFLHLVLSRVVAGSRYIGVYTTKKRRATRGAGYQIDGKINNSGDPEMCGVMKRVRFVMVARFTGRYE